MGESIEISSITENDCNAFLYRKGDVVTRYWHSQHYILKKLFEWAFSRGLIQNIPIPVRRLPLEEEDLQAFERYGISPR